MSEPSQAKTCQRCHAITQQLYQVSRDGPWICWTCWNLSKQGAVTSTQAQPSWNADVVAAHLRVARRLERDITALRQGGEIEGRLIQGALRGLEQALIAGLTDVMEAQIRQATLGVGNLPAAPLAVSDDSAGTSPLPPESSKSGPAAG